MAKVEKKEPAIKLETEDQDKVAIVDVIDPYTGKATGSKEKWLKLTKKEVADLQVEEKLVGFRPFKNDKGELCKQGDFVGIGLLK